MSNKIDDVVIPILRTIQNDTSVLKRNVLDLKNDMAIVKESIRRIDTRLSGVDAIATATYNTIRWHEDDLNALRRTHRGSGKSLQTA
jgi:hypothetical protein